MHAAVDRRKAVMLRMESALPFDSCCGKPDAFNPETTLSTDTPDFYSVKIRHFQWAFRWLLSWLSISGGYNHGVLGQCGTRWQLCRVALTLT